MELKNNKKIYQLNLLNPFRHFRLHIYMHTL